MNMFNDTEIYEKTYEEALKNNERMVAEIEEFKKELQGVRENLEKNQKHLFQTVMVPITSQALIRGKLVHTNEVFVYLGDNYFVRTSADRAIQICDRKLERCNANLAEIESQTKRFSSNVEKSHELDIFPTDDVKDIIEPYDEEAEKLWREKHREKVREYKRKERAERDIEDVFQKLELLEKEENELIYAETSTDEHAKSMCTFDTQDSIVSSDYSEKHQKKRVSFSDSAEIQDYSPVDVPNSDDIDIIQFKHSTNKPSNISTNSQEIRSPTDIYRIFLQNYYPKSILKNKVENNGENFEYCKDGVRKTFSNSIDVESKPVTPLLEDLPLENVFGDIVERIPNELRKTDKLERPMSKFKKSRLKNLQ